MTTLHSIQSDLNNAVSILDSAPNRPTMDDIAWDVTGGEIAPSRRGWDMDCATIALVSALSLVSAAVSMLAGQ